MRLTIVSVAKALRAEGEVPLEERVRTAVRAIVHAFQGRQRARKAVVQAVLAQGMAIEMAAPVAAFIADAESSPQRGMARLSREQQFVVSRALMGAIRAAVLEEASFFKSRAFEDELVRLVLCYVASLSKPTTMKPSL